MLREMLPARSRFHILSSLVQFIRFVINEKRLEATAPKNAAAYIYIYQPKRHFRLMPILVLVISSGHNEGRRVFSERTKINEPSKTHPTKKSKATAKVDS